MTTVEEIHYHVIVVTNDMGIISRPVGTDKLVALVRAKEFRSHFPDAKSVLLQDRISQVIATF